MWKNQRERLGDRDQPSAFSHYGGPDETVVPIGDFTSRGRGLRAATTTTAGGHGRGAVTTPYRHPSADKLTATGWEGRTAKPRGLRRWSLSSASTASLIRSLI